MKSTNYDEMLRVLRRELSLVNGQQAKPTKIAAAHTPIWRRFLEGREVREIRKSAARFEKMLNQGIPKPKTREDHDLLRKGRSPEEIKSDINAIPAISARCLTDAFIRFDDFIIFQLWFAPTDRYLGRDWACFVTSRVSISTETFQDSPGFDTAFPHYSENQIEEVSIRSDEKDRSALLTHENGNRWVLSRATLALLKSDVRFCANPRHSNYDVFLGHPKQPSIFPNDPFLLLHLVRKSDQQSKQFLISESRE